jgi:hypothetical protein
MFVIALYLFGSRPAQRAFHNILSKIRVKASRKASSGELPRPQPALSATSNGGKLIYSLSFYVV